MKKLIALIMLIAVLPTAAFAAPQRSGERVTVIVKVSGGAVLESKNAADLGLRLFSETDEAENIKEAAVEAQSGVLREIERRIDKNAELGYSYTHTINGFSVDVYEEDIDKIKALPDVENVYISKKLKAPEPYAEETYVENGASMMKTELLHEEGVSGQGMVIAVIDNGFDLTHRYFSGDITGASLSRNDIVKSVDEGLSASVIASDAYINKKIPFAYNYDDKTANTYNPSNSHGTHVAGIAGGNSGEDPYGNKFIGTAPDAQLLLLASPSLSEASLAAAIDDAAKLGADVINLSWGDDNIEENDVLGYAIQNAANAGIIISAAAGNEARGADGSARVENIDYSRGGVPRDFSFATSVASADNNKYWYFYHALTLSDGGDKIEIKDQNSEESFVDKFSDKSYSYIYCSEGKSEGDFPEEVTGGIALIKRGDDGTTFAKRITSAANAGAEGVIFINNEDDINLQIAQTSLRNMPAVIVKSSDGDRLINAEIKEFSVKPEQIVEHVEKDYAEMSSFSSWGTNSTLELKPEITAPGGMIYSSVNDDKYDNMSGTSMAAPHLAGAAALLKQYIESNKVKYNFGGDADLAGLTESILMTAASVMRDKDGTPCSPRQQGAGMANLEAAVKTPVILAGTNDIDGGKPKISLGELEDEDDSDDTFSFTLKFNAQNISDKDAAYDSIRVSVITDEADEEGYVAGVRKLAEDMTFDGITVTAGETKEIELTITLDQAELDKNKETFVNGFFIDGFVFLSATDDNPEISVPFTSFYGDWSAAPTLDEPYYSETSVLKGTYLYSYARRTATHGSSSVYSRFILGSNLYADADDEDYDEYSSESFSGISPIGENYVGTPHIIFAPLRYTGVTSYWIEDSIGNKMTDIKYDISDDGTIYYSPKFLSSYLDFKAEEISDLKDGDYKAVISTSFHRSERQERAEMKFYIDREKPVITGIELDESGTALKITASDNRNLMGFTLSGNTIGGEKFYMTSAVKGLSTAEAEFDISDADLSTVKAEAVDYAYNSVSKSIPALYAAYETETADENKTQYIFSVKNVAEEPVEAALILALYKDGALVDVDIQNGTYASGVSYQSFDMQTVEYDEMKLYIWKSVKNMVPLF